MRRIVKHVDHEHFRLLVSNLISHVWIAPFTNKSRHLNPAFEVEGQRPSVFQPRVARSATLGLSETISPFTGEPQRGSVLCARGGRNPVGVRTGAGLVVLALFPGFLLREPWAG